MIRIAVFTDMMDRKAKATALYTRKIVEGLLQDPQFDVYLVHSKPTDNPIYRRAKEILLPQVRVPKLSKILSETIFLWKTRNSFDIIEYPQESIYPLFWLSHAKVIITVHSHIEGWRDYGLRTRYFMVYATLRFFSGRISAIICPITSVKDSIQRFFSVPDNKFFIIPLGVEEMFHHPPSKEEAQKHIAERYHLPMPFIFAPGRIDPQKNIPRVIEAFAQLGKEHNIPQALVVGGKQHKEEVKKVDSLIQERKLESQVSYLPYVEDDDMPTLYKAADVIVYPSLHEGIGLPLIETMAVGTPLVASNVYAFPETTRGAALLVDPRDPSAIAGAIWKLLTDKTLAEELIKKGKERSQYFSWDTMAKEMKEVYKKVLA
jgi:glycosyltransferase involved in cell wall biosynthesis